MATSARLRPSNITTLRWSVQRELRNSYQLTSGKPGWFNVTLAGKPLKRLLSFVANFALALAAHAQSPCPNSDLSDYPGAWKPRAGYEGAAQFRALPGSYSKAAADATLNKLLAIVQAAYPEPKGGMAYFEKSLLFSSPDRELPFGYALYVGHGAFGCTTANRLIESSTTGVFLNVDVNSFWKTSLLSPVTAPASTGSSKFNADEDGNYRIGGRLVYRVPSVYDRYNEADRYSKLSRANRGGAPTEQFFVVRKSETPLFTYVTRRDYLKQFRDELGYYKSLELERFRANAGDPAFSAEWQARFLKSIDAYIRAVDSYIKDAPETELIRPISELLPHFPVELDNPHVDFKEGDYHLAWLNPDYLDKKQPHHVPQFVVIRWTIKDTAKPAAWEQRFRNSISTRLDFAAIKALLGKP